MVVKTFRGLLANGGQDRIRLSTIKGKVGYKIIKFQLMPLAPGTLTQELVSQVFTDEQSAVSGTVNFTDATLLAAAIFATSADSFNTFETVIFDNKIFNQDIYVTVDDSQDAGGSNYYLELEVIPLDDAGAEYTTLKDMRQA